MKSRKGEVDLKDQRLAQAETAADEAESLIMYGNYDNAIKKAEEALESSPKLSRAHKYIGLALFFKGDSINAIKHLKLACEINPKYASSWFNLACIYAQTEQKSLMMHALGEAIVWGLREYTVDYREKALNDPDFAYYLHDEEFMALCSPVPEDIEQVYRALNLWEFDDVISRGKLILQKENISDELAVVDAIRYAAESIVSDLEEHGDVNLDLYEGDSLDHYRKIAQEYGSRAAKMRKGGAESRVLDISRGTAYKDENSPVPSIEELMRIRKTSA
ncbi:MAG: hypothetical protein GF388_06445 [Candidatus Aegiribacteria sp.]|nr:hypothetical protein [Candidatus Aegiribacteria sp.]MBD3294798.1 hypothetical protein [Candidatus Fermentibacteria bacterium]